VVVGKNCFIVGFVGISGSTVVEDDCIIGGQVGMAGHLRVGKGTMIGAQTGLNHDLEPGSYVRGTPAFPYMLAHRIDLLKRRLPEIFKRVDNLEKVFAYLTTDATKSLFQKHAQSVD
jgi:UDP-3-O-[3-hydroxymyristoyl] glucosamine N-acyltransferase